MKFWDPDSGNGAGGGAAAAVTPPAAEPSVLGGEPSSAAAAPDTSKAETKPAEGETKAPAGETKDAKAETKAPALVDDKWEPKPAPEGLQRDPKVFGEARGLFKKLGLNAEQAQALVEFSDAQAKALAEQVSGEDAQWVKEITTDTELGGAKLAQTRESVRQLIRELKSGPALAKWLDERGIGNAAPLVRAFAELAARTAEDTVKDTVKDAGAAAVDEHERRVSRTYGNTQRKES